MDTFAPESVDRFIHFLYTKRYDDYEPITSTTQDANSSSVGNAAHHIFENKDNQQVVDKIIVHAHMIAMGDFYLVSRLVRYANQQVEELLGTISGNTKWIEGLPKCAEAALSIVENDELSKTFASTIADNINAILVARSLEFSSHTGSLYLGIVKNMADKLAKSHQDPDHHRRRTRLGSDSAGEDCLILTD